MQIVLLIDILQLLLQFAFNSCIMKYKFVSGFLLLVLLFFLLVVFVVVFSSFTETFFGGGWVGVTHFTQTMADVVVEPGTYIFFITNGYPPPFAPHLRCVQQEIVVEKRLIV